MKLPVLGRWKNEDGLRDHIAKHLETLELNRGKTRSYGVEITRRSL